MDGLNYSDNLRTYRIGKHLLQKNVAAELNISRDHYSRLENGKANPSYKLLMKIARMTHQEFDDMNGLHDPHSPSKVGIRRTGDLCSRCRYLSRHDATFVARLTRFMSEMG